MTQKLTEEQFAEAMLENVPEGTRTDEKFLKSISFLWQKYEADPNAGDDVSFLKRKSPALRSSPASRQLKAPSELQIQRPPIEQASIIQSFFAGAKKVITVLQSPNYYREDGSETPRPTEDSSQEEKDAWQKVRTWTLNIYCTNPNRYVPGVNMTQAEAIKCFITDRYVFNDDDTGYPDILDVKVWDASFSVTDETFPDPHAFRYAEEIREVTRVPVLEDGDEMFEALKTMLIGNQFECNSRKVWDAFSQMWYYFIEMMPRLAQIHTDNRQSYHGYDAYIPHELLFKLFGIPFYIYVSTYVQPEKLDR